MFDSTGVRLAGALAQRTRVLRSALTILTLVAAWHFSQPLWHASAATQNDITGPSGSGAFGETVTVLPNGNLVVTDSLYDLTLPVPVADVGAVYLYNGATGALISTLAGSTAGDQVGNGGVTVLANGNFAVRSLCWNGKRGAVTWGHAATGVAGAVSAANSLTGSTADDFVGGGGLTALSNGNFVVSSPNWNGNRGAVTWCNGAGGSVGALAASNSLVGSAVEDCVGLGGVTALTNGNFVVSSPNWNGKRGAATWCNGGNGTTGVGGSAGALTAANSLTGSTLNDCVSSGGVTALANGNFVVNSPNWDNAAIVDAGAVSWGNGTSGSAGTVGAGNSLLGNAAGDCVGAGGVTALTNGNYVVSSPKWNNGAVTDAGAATFCNGANGAGGCTGAVLETNSLAGGGYYDQVSNQGVTALSNGNYVVSSSNWDGQRGAATWCNGASGLAGNVSASNSLTGSAAKDQVGASGAVALSNGHYIVRSPFWNSKRGAATFGNGASGITGAVSAANSLVGAVADDCIANYGVTALANGAYVVSSPNWNARRGAATWGGASGIIGAVSAANSLVGSAADDFVGGFGITALTNGHYVVSSPGWSGGRGAVTWCSGTAGRQGAVAESNSLTGSALDDAVGHPGVTCLTNGNYVVSSANWNGRTGAVTWGNGAAGLTGAVSAANSLIGNTADDFNGNHGVLALANGNFIVRNPNWDNGATAEAGASTYGAGYAATITGALTTANSVRAAVAFGGSNLNAVYDAANERLVVGQPDSNLVSLFRPTYTAIADGNWNASATWDFGAFSKAQDVTVPEPRAITCNVDATANNLTIAAGGALTIAAGKTLTVNGTLTNQGTLQVLGTLVYNGAITGAGTVAYAGSAAQVIPATLGTVNHLTINNAAGVTLGGPLTINGTLTLTTDLATGGHTLTLGNSANASGSGDVVGPVKRTGLVNGTAYAFGNPDNQIIFNSGTPPTDFTVNLTKSAPSGLGSAVTRQYTLTQLNGSGFTAMVRLRYLQGEAGSLDESTLQLWRYNGSAWVAGGTASNRDATANWVEASGVTAFSPWAIGAPNAPTDVRLMTFSATAQPGASGVAINWRTGYEADSLGFNLYREVGGQRVKLNASLIAGAALLAGERAVLTAGNGYAWTDAPMSVVAAGASYRLEEINLRGVSVWHGPVYVSGNFSGTNATLQARASVLEELNAQANRTAQIEYVATETADTQSDGLIERGATQLHTTAAQLRVAEQPWTLPNEKAAKLTVKQNGWYRVTAAELKAVGFNTNVNPGVLQLFADGAEVPLRASGKGNSVDLIEFYGRGVETPTTDTRVYWLTVGQRAGLRIEAQNAKAAGAPNTSSFLTTVERKDRLIYFSGLLNGEAENWFGPVVNAAGATQKLTTRFVDRQASAATLEVVLQGVTEQAHSVNIELNGRAAGAVNFSGKQGQQAQLQIPASWLVEGENEIRCTALAGASDISLIESVRLSYQRGFIAENDALNFSLAPGKTALLSGFSTPNIRLLEFGPGVEEVRELTVKTQAVARNSFGFVLLSGSGGRYLAVADASLARVVAVSLNQLSNWRAATNGANLVIVTHRNFWNAANRLAAARRMTELRVAVVDVEDAYDEFAYGQRTPQALKDLLTQARTSWVVKPKYALFIGDATTDRLNYLNLANADFVPTKLGATAYFETALDNWFADADGDGMPEIALGRLPVRTAAQAEAVVTKLLAFKPTAQPRGALLVSDRVSDGVNYQAQSEQLAALLPALMLKQFVNRNDGAPEQVRAQILNTLKLTAPLVVNWLGHGSTQVWTGDGLLRTQDAAALTNTAHGLYVMTTCLNGYFADPVQTSLGEAMLTDTTGGAFAVVASSALNPPAPQQLFNQAFYLALFGKGLTLGEAMTAARLAAGDKDVRNSYVLFGDPTLKLR